MPIKGIRRKKKKLDMSESVPVKKHYFRRFFYAFSICFIVFGLIGVVWFVYTQDPNAFGSSVKYLDRGYEALEQSDLKTALEYFEKCLEEDPKESEARLKAVEIYRAQGNYQKAEKLLTEGLSLQPRYEEYYRQMIYLFTEQNRIAEALDYMNGITTTYIVVKLNEERPSAITSQPLPGVFSQGMDVTLNVPENTTVYYTTDGSAPDRNSEIYIPGTSIRVDRGTVHLRAVALNDAGMPSMEYNAAYRVYNENTEYQFKDAKIEKLVRLMLNKPSGTVYYKDLEGITTVDCSAGAAAGVKGSVSVLDDLLEMANLTTLNLDGEKEISSLDPLRRLSQLRTLSMDGCGLTDGHLSQLSMIIWLTSLSVENNEITTLSPIVSMVSLSELDASGNSIKSVPQLTRLASLRTLDLSGNALSSLSWLAGHQSVSVLNVSNNLIPDISDLVSCVALTDLNISSNLVTSLTPLAACRRLSTLDISGNDIVTLQDLQGLTGLINLSASNTKISSVEHLSLMTGLTTLNVSGTLVRDFTPLAGSPLKNLYASECGISDLSSLVMLGALEVLDVSGNALREIGAVALMYRLSILNISNNYITDFTPLLNCSDLTSVRSSGSKIPDSIRASLSSKGVTVVQ
ncbi:MAG: chitobiase/beta-hexosaminidase C-terminal domain-containing protein [Clostridia bacterium]|nr:chitobiase/beta-hexosaminidase C-terminal domain-containing protein [Clostridia bacterium]